MKTCFLFLFLQPPTAPPPAFFHGSEQLAGAQASMGTGMRRWEEGVLEHPQAPTVDSCRGWDVLDPDSSACVFGCLDDPADFVRAAAVSHSWRRFVLENDNRIFVCLNGAFVSTTKPSTDCIKHCIGASSTDNFPDESMENTLEPHDRVTLRPSYWSSGGQVNPDVPESLTYKLKPAIFIIDEIRVQPFKAYLQPDQPIYSSKTVRIRMGHSKPPHLSESFVTDEDENMMAIADANYEWTYTSPEFPMLQKNELQSFKLPCPVICFGGVVKIELLGRVQKRAADDRYYICVCHAQVIGRSFSPVKVIRA